MSDRDGDGDADASMTCLGPIKRKGKVIMSDLDLLNYYEMKLGSGKSCSCQGNCLCILDDQVICTPLLQVIWFDLRGNQSRSKIT